MDSKVSRSELSAFMLEAGNVPGNDWSMKQKI